MCQLRNQDGSLGVRGEKSLAFWRFILGGSCVARLTHLLLVALFNLIHVLMLMVRCGHIELNSQKVSKKKVLKREKGIIRSAGTWKRQGLNNSMSFLYILVPFALSVEMPIAEPLVCAVTFSSIFTMGQSHARSHRSRNKAK
jgi:hypothetical protein